MANTYGTSKLADAILSAVRERMGNTICLELGVIQPNLSLLLDKFAVAIPPDGYLKTRWLSGYQLERGGMTPTLKPGDRVLVAWVNGGQDPIILDVVVSMSA